MAFLTARWCHLFLANYPVPAALLQARLPPGLTLDQRDGQAFVSLVAFQFLDTRVLGVPWPGFRDFAELNLRYYVRRGDERGVVFVREFVPQRLTAWVARVLYNEPYQAAPLTGRVQDAGAHVTAAYALDYAGQRHAIRVTGSKPAVRPAETSAEHWFKEHHWGYGVTRGGKLIRYRVEHPVWDVYPVTDFQIQLDWAAVYGPEWQVLQHEQPASTVFAVGSAIRIFAGETIPPA